MRHKKNQDKNEHPALLHNIILIKKKYNLQSMLIFRFFCENSPRIIAASGADPAVLKTGSQALVCQYLPNLYTNFTKLSNTPLIRQCALICTHS